MLPSFGSAEPLPDLFADYCCYYGVDFAAELPEIEHRAGRVVSGDHSLLMHHWVNSQASATLFLVHGYLDHTGIFGKLVSWALCQGYSVIAFDLPGHGLSSGEAAAIDDFSDYSRAIHDVLMAAGNNPFPLWAMGQSTGCAALIDYAKTFPAWPFAATVLLAPLVQPSNWRLVNLAQRFVSVFSDGVKRTFVRNSSDAEFLAFLRSDPLQSQRISVRWIAALRRWLKYLPPEDLGVGPALVIQGDQDATVDWRYNLPFIESLFPRSQIVCLNGAGHQLANESRALREQYLAEVERYLAERNICQQ